MLIVLIALSGFKITQSRQMKPHPSLIIKWTARRKGQRKKRCSAFHICMTFCKQSWNAHIILYISMLPTLKPLFGNNSTRNIGFIFLFLKKKKTVCMFWILDEHLPNFKCWANCTDSNCAPQNVSMKPSQANLTTILNRLTSVTWTVLSKECTFP